MKTAAVQTYPMTANHEGDITAINATQQEIVDEFAFFDDWADRYKYIIDLGKKLPAFPEDQLVDENKLSGCQSQVWFVSEVDKGGKLHFKATSDAVIVSGLIALLLRVYSGRAPRAILSTQPAFIDQIGLKEHLSPTRSNGLASMVKAIHNLALKAAG